MMRALVVIALLAGCGEINVAALTPPPPGKVAELDAENLTLDLSRGIAFAFDCTASADGYSGPCRAATASTTDATVASVYPSYLDTLVPAWNNGSAGPRSRTAFVVVALAGGSTELRIETSEGDLSLDVTVRDE